MGEERGLLTLALLVARVITNDKDDAAALNDFALLTTALYGWFHLHGDTPSNCKMLL
jgi:hypothetical protein